MRRIAVINQKGGVGKTTTSANLGAALAEQGRRVVVIDMDAQANLSLSLGVELASDAPSTYTVLTGESTIAQALRPTALANLSLIGSNIDLSGAELELAGAIGREHLMRDALSQWESEHRKAHGTAPADYVIFDCPPSLGLLSINALAAAGEVLITLQTEFLALQGMTKLVDVVQILRRRLNPNLVITGIVPCLYDSRLKLAREVLGEIRKYFGAQVFPHPVRTNVKLAEAPSYGKTIFEYAPDSNGAQDYRWVAQEVMSREARDPDLAQLPAHSDTLRARPSSDAPSSATKPAPAAPSIAPARSVAAPDDASKPVQREAKPTPAAIKPAPTKRSSAPVDLAAAVPKPSELVTPATPKRKLSTESQIPATPTAKPSGELVTPETPKRKLSTESLTPATPAAKPSSGLVAPATDKRKRATKPPIETLNVAPATPPAAADTNKPARRVLRAEDLPPLPPDAFEILTNYVRDA
jgi:chromosome partitioning protein